MGRTIRRIQVTIIPWVVESGRVELRLETTVGGEVYTAVEIVEVDHFEALIDILLRRAGDQLKRLVKEDADA